MDKELFSYCHAMKISCTSNNPLVLQLTVHTSLNYTQKRLQLSLVMQSRTRNPRGTTSTFKSPTRTRPRKLIPEQNPKPDIQTPKPRKSPKVLNLYIKYLKNTIKINKKTFLKFFFKIYYTFFFLSTFKSQKINAYIFVEIFFKQNTNIIVVHTG